MAYFEFPHARTYDSDLGWLIKNFKSLSDLVEALEEWKARHEPEYQDLYNKVDGLIHNLVDVIVPWDSSVAYHIFSIVEYQGTNYIAVQDVPVGVMITNTEYWEPANTVVEQLNAISVVVSELMNEKFMYKVTDYDVIADSDEDQYPELFSLFKTVEAAGGGVIYFPRGKYIISDTLFIPANTTVIGDGAASEIYYTEKYHSYGMGLSNGGDNVTICNIKVNHADSGDIIDGAMNGAVGISDFDSSEITEPHEVNLVRVYDRRGVTIKNLYCDNRYALQTECGNQINSVFVDGVFAPNGKVSFLGGYKSTGISYKNIECSFFNFYSPSEDSYAEADTIRCNTAYIGARAYSIVKVHNMYVDASKTKTPWLATSPVYINGSAQLEDCAVVDTLDYDFSIVKSTLDYSAYFEKVRTSGSKRAFNNQRGLAAINANYDYFYDCILNQTTSTPCALIGRGERNTLHSSIHLISARAPEWIASPSWTADETTAANTVLSQPATLYLGTYLVIITTPYASGAVPLSLRTTIDGASSNQIVGTTLANAYNTIAAIVNITSATSQYGTLEVISSGGASVTFTNKNLAGLKIIRL